jgi:hypothetical protein
MKKHVLPVLFGLLFVYSPGARSQEFGKIHALEQRAAYVVKQKNDFVSRVLTSYKIPLQCNDQGVVVRIKMEGKWLNIRAVEIVPVIKESDDKSQHVVAYELFFYTGGKILDLVSEMIIR